MKNFYADNGLIVLTWAGRLQRNFDVLTDLFDRISLQTNTRKTVGVVCQPYHFLVRMLVDAYNHRIIGEGLAYQKRLQQRVRFPECVVELAGECLHNHRYT